MTRQFSTKDRMNSNLFGLLYYHNYLKLDHFCHYERKIKTVEQNVSISTGKEIVLVHTTTPISLYVHLLEGL